MSPDHCKETYDLSDSEADCARTTDDSSKIEGGIEETSQKDEFNEPKKVLVSPADLDDVSRTVNLCSNLSGHKATASVARLRPKVHYLKLMIVGESGLGKSTFVNTLFHSLLSGRQIMDERQRKQISSCVAEPYGGPTVEKLERSAYYQLANGDEVVLTIVDFPGYGTLNHEVLTTMTADQLSLAVQEQLRPDKWGREMVDYVDEMNFEYYEKNPTGMSGVADVRVNLALFFMRPHRVSPTDISLLEMLNAKVAVIPIFAKRDAMTEHELDAHKERVLSVLDRRDIRCFDFSEEARTHSSVSRFLNLRSPFAVISCRDSSNDESKQLHNHTRLYPWGAAEAFNPFHSDTVALKTLITEVGFEDIMNDTNERYHRFTAEIINCEKQRKWAEIKREKEKEVTEREARRQRELIRSSWRRRFFIWLQTTNILSSCRKCLVYLVCFLCLVAIFAQAAASAYTARKFLEAAEDSFCADHDKFVDGCFSGDAPLSTMCKGRKHEIFGYIASAFLSLAICLDVIFILTIAVKYLGRGFLDTICCTNIPKEQHATFEGPATDKEDIITIEVKD